LGLGEPIIIEGPVNTFAFEQYIEKVLAPSLTTGQVVLIDNLAAHKGKRVENLITVKGCDLLFLPGYPPDFSTTEEAFSTSNLTAQSYHFSLRNGSKPGAKANSFTIADSPNQVFRLHFC
jgi:transposase